MMAILTSQEVMSPILDVARTCLEHSRGEFEECFAIAARLGEPAGEMEQVPW